MNNDGKAFEDLVEEIYKILYKKYPNAKFGRNEHLKSRDGSEVREFDITISHNIAGSVSKTFVECKDENKKFGSGDLDSVLTRLRDFDFQKAIVVNKKGFVKPVIQKCNRLGISLFKMEDTKLKEYSLEDNIPILFSSYYAPCVNFKVSGLVVSGKETIIPTPNNINNLNINKEFWELWASDKIHVDPFSTENTIKNIEMPALKRPFFSMNNKGEKYIFDENVNIEISLTLKKKFYLGYLNEIARTRILNAQSEKTTTQILVDSSIVDVFLSEKLKPFDSLSDIPQAQNILKRYSVRLNIEPETFRNNLK